MDGDENEAPVRFCQFCGADDETDASVVSGFLSIPVVTPAGVRPIVVTRHVCSCCLSMLLSAVFQRAQEGLGTALANAAIEAEQEEGA